MEHLVFWTSSGKFCVRSGEGGCIVSNAHKPLGPFGDQLYAVYMENRFLPQKVRVFIDYLLEKIGETPDWDDFLR